MARLHPSHRHLRREQAIRDAVDTSASDITARTRKPPLSPLEYIDLAAREELLFKDEVAAVQQLRSLRNQAAHSLAGCGKIGVHSEISLNSDFIEMPTV